MDNSTTALDEQIYSKVDILGNMSAMQGDLKNQLSATNAVVTVLLANLSNLDSKVETTHKDLQSQELNTTRMRQLCLWTGPYHSSKHLGMNGVD
jgi:hypothetical protein